jgi:hypothetical protein
MAWDAIRGRSRLRSNYIAAEFVALLAHATTALDVLVFIFLGVLIVGWGIGCTQISAKISEFVGQVHGAGETAWVRDGKIVATSGLGLNTACFEPNTAALLAMS